MRRAIQALIALALIAAFAAVPVSAQEPDGSSTITVQARGRQGTETMVVSVNGQEIGRVTGIADQFAGHQFQVTEPTTVDSLRVSILGGGWPEALVIDRIQIDGTTYQTENIATESNGSWNSATGCARGFKIAEWLQCRDGWFEYGQTHGLNLAASATPPVDPPDPGPGPSNPPLVIFDTDMGPDIDDALALAMLHAYENRGMIDLAAVTISRNSNTGARYADLLNTFYGRPDIPIGVYRGSTTQDANDHNYTRDMVNSGRYPYSLAQPIPEAVDVIRSVLTGAADQSVIIIQVGFSTNVAELLDSGPDDIELARDKVKLLSVMAGRNGANSAEFNIDIDVPAAQIVFNTWPGQLLQSDGNLGHEILYPLSSIQTDFEYIEDHPIKRSYLNNDLSWHEDQPPSYNMRAWDLTSVIAAIEDPAEYFNISTPGLVSVAGDGTTDFTPSASGNHRTLGVHWELNAADKAKIVARMIELTAEQPLQLGPVHECPVGVGG